MGNFAIKGFYPSVRGVGRVVCVALLGWTLTACTTTPVTGRAAFNLMDPSDDKELGADAYDQLLAEATFETRGARYDQVQRVVSRLVAVADDLHDFEWDVKLVVDDATVNAWCLPGGKMAVYTGILPFTRDDTGLAVVMGHEIGHAVARHGTERMSQQGVAQPLLDFVGGTYGGTVAEATAMVAKFGIEMPWGRTQELEADHIGLIYMARAGYDPREAAAFWTRMAAGKDSETWEILSTHPSDETRIERINELLPEALAVYKNSTPAP
jgi:predicted Zn-dependent protease